MYPLLSFPFFSSYSYTSSSPFPFLFQCRLQLHPERHNAGRLRCAYHGLDWPQHGWKVHTAASGVCVCVCVCVRLFVVLFVVVVHILIYVLCFLSFFSESVFFFNAQTCVAVIMAQLGCYVPAESMTLTATGRRRGGKSATSSLLLLLLLLFTFIFSPLF